MREAGFVVLECAVKEFVAVTLDELRAKFLELRKEF
jgi:hypothetical protein